MLADLSSKLPPWARSRQFGIAAVLCVVAGILIVTRGDKDSGGPADAEAGKRSPNLEGSRSSGAPQRGYPPELYRVVASGLQVSGSKELDQYVAASKGSASTLIGAHILSGEEKHRKALVESFAKNPDSKVAAYLSMTAPNSEEKLLFANKSIELAPDNSVSYLMKLSCLSQGDAEEYNRTLQAALDAPVCNAEFEWFRSSKEDALKALKWDSASIAADRVHSKWEASITKLVDPLVVPVEGETAEAVAAKSSLVRSLGADLPEDSWKVRILGIAGSELALLRRLPGDWGYEEQQSVAERVAELSLSRRKALARLSEVQAVLREGSPTQAQNYFVILGERGQKEADKWLLGDVP